jgi:hypothetical protein
MNRCCWCVCKALYHMQCCSARVLLEAITMLGTSRLLFRPKLPRLRVDMSQSRKRFEGDHEELLETLRPFVKHVGWLQYGDKPSFPVNSAILVGHKIMIRAITAICPNLAFTDTQCIAAFRQLADSGFTQLHNDDLKEDWAQTMTKRFKIVCRHVAQSRVKKVKWLAHIDGPMAAERRESPAAQAPTRTYHHSNRAYQQQAPGHARQVRKTYIPIDDSDNASVMFQWPLQSPMRPQQHQLPCHYRRHSQHQHQAMSADDVKNAKVPKPPSKQAVNDTVGALQ